MLVTSDITLLWPMEFYTHKGQKLLYEGMEIVSAERLPYGGMKQVTENTGKFEACVTSLLRNIRRYFSHCCLHHVQWRNMLRKVSLLGLGQKLLTSLVVQHCSRELLAHFQLKKKSGSLLTPSRSLIFRLLWKQRRAVNVPLL